MTLAEAASSISQSPTIHITTAAHALSMLRARNAVKEELRKQGLKVSHFAAREITALASQYLAEHRSELMPDAIETITQWTLRGDFGKRAQRAALERFAQTQNAQNSIASSVHMSGAK